MLEVKADGFDAAFDAAGLAAALSAGDPLQAAATLGSDAAIEALGRGMMPDTDARYESERAWVLSGLASAAGDALGSAYEFGPGLGDDQLPVFGVGVSWVSVMARSFRPGRYSRACPRSGR